MHDLDNSEYEAQFILLESYSTVSHCINGHSCLSPPNNCFNAYVLLPVGGYAKITVQPTLHPYWKVKKPMVSALC